MLQWLYARFIITSHYYSDCEIIMKKSFSLAAILTAAALTSGVMLASLNPAQASPCPFRKDKGINPTTVGGEAPSLSSTRLDSDNADTNNNNMGIIGAGMAAVAGLFVAGMVYKARRAGQQADTVVAEVPQEESFEATSFPIPIPPEALSASTSEQENSDSTADKDLTLVG
jgi:hypothetical protein